MHIQNNDKEQTQLISSLQDSLQHYKGLYNELKDKALYVDELSKRQAEIKDDYDSIIQNKDLLIKGMKDSQNQNLIMLDELREKLKSCEQQRDTQRDKAHSEHDQKNQLRVDIADLQSHNQQLSRKLQVSAVLEELKFEFLGNGGCAEK